MWRQCIVSLLGIIVGMGEFLEVNKFLVVMVDGETQIEADEFWKLAQKRLDLQGSTFRWKVCQ
jgi:hypothetical protein